MADSGPPSEVVVMRFQVVILSRAIPRAFRKPRYTKDWRYGSADDLATAAALLAAAPIHWKERAVIVDTETPGDRWVAIKRGQDA